jgi:hypothetical protein
MYLMNTTVSVSGTSLGRDNPISRTSTGIRCTHANSTYAFTIILFSYNRCTNPRVLRPAANLATDEIEIASMSVDLDRYTHNTHETTDEVRRAIV